MTRPDDDLRSLIQRGDPAGDGSEPTLEESAALRSIVLRRAQAARPPIAWLPLGLAAAAALIAAVLLVSPATDSPDSTATRPEVDPKPRQIQFATDEGTQIIWVLDPNLEL